MLFRSLGLPKLKPESPWFGYSLGEWPQEMEESARRATRGDYFETGALLEKSRRKDVRMNTEVRNVQEKNVQVKKVQMKKIRARKSKPRKRS